MEDKVLDFIRDRFNSLETHMTKGFEEVKTTMSNELNGQDTRIRALEDEKAERKGKLVAYGSIGGIISTVIFWVSGKAW
jgi:hypothetical protein